MWSGFGPEVRSDCRTVIKTTCSKTYVLAWSFNTFLHDRDLLCVSYWIENLKGKASSQAQWGYKGRNTPIWGMFSVLYRFEPSISRFDYPVELHGYTWSVGKKIWNKPWSWCGQGVVCMFRNFTNWSEHVEQLNLLNFSRFHVCCTDGGVVFFGYERNAVRE